MARSAVPAVVTGAASALPPARAQDELWERFFASHFEGVRWARRVYDSAGVRRRGTAVDPTTEDVSGWSTGARMARYAAEALPLGKSAVAGALAAAGVAPDQVGLFAVASCTGYSTPGTDVLLARDLGMSSDTRRLLIGHMGCHAAMPGLGAVTDYVVGHGRPGVLLCLELSSLHLQPSSGDLEQVVVHSLFGDAAAAVVVEPGGADRMGIERVGAGLTLVDLVAYTEPATADHMTWDVTDLGFRMGLSRQVPDVLARAVRPLVTDLLAAHALTLEDVAGWAVHPGGPRVLDVVADRLALNDDPDHGALAESRHVLAEHGNCSSATVLLVLEEVRQRPLPPGSAVVALAFGPGLTLYAALLRA